MTGRLWMFVSDVTLDLSTWGSRLSESLYRISVYCWERSMGG